VPSSQKTVPERRRSRWTVLRPVVAAAALTAVIVGVMVLGAPRPAAASVLSEAVPRVVTDPDTNAVELGVAFSASKDITVTGIRFYQGPRNSGPHAGRIWTPDGQLLRTVSFASTRTVGWVTATLDQPLLVKAGTPLIASYVAPHGHYADDPDGFSKPISDGVVTYPRGAGLYSYQVGSVPNSNWRNSNYYVDVAYTLGGASPAPTSGATSTPTSSPSASPSSAPTTPAGGSSAGGTGSVSAGGSLNLPRVAWWGGPSYYAKFPKAAASGWTSPSFFPIAVFYGKPGDAPTLASLGVNTYMGAEHDGSPISTVTSTGISVLAQDEWSPAELGNDQRVVGYHVSDECEMGSSGCDGSTETSRLATQQSLAAGFASRNDGRFLQSNFGNGVLGSFWAPNTMSQFIRSVDVSSVDKYAYTSPAVDGVIQQSSYWPNGANPASSAAYGWLQTRMASYTNAAVPNWVFVETAKPFLTEAGARTITPDQIEGAVWDSIIDGASGIAYFQHNNNGQCGTYSLISCGATLQNKVKAIDAQVQRLAPVINTQSYAWSFGPGLNTSLKVSGGYAYIFAMTDGSTGSKTFTLPPGVTGSVEVVDENRTITPSNGAFADTFGAEYTHHIYRIKLG
jgi:hypothetical protein